MYVEKKMKRNFFLLSQNIFSLKENSDEKFSRNFLNFKTNFYEEIKKF